MRTFFVLMRPRTLPLAVAVILCGNGLAFNMNHWRVSVFLLSLLTALALQILSNVANDYGDGIRGTDTLRAKDSPQRLTASGDISPHMVRQYVVFSVFLSLLSGGVLLLVSVRNFAQLLVFLGLGVLSILAALTYTIGRKPYGYVGLGEVSVFIFFGWVGVLGSYVLHQAPLRPSLFLPATAIGCLSAAVLNINNIRDIDSDNQFGKLTLAVRLGFQRAKQFQILLLSISVICLLCFNLSIWQSALWLLLLPQLCQHGRRVLGALDVQTVGKELKSIVLLTLGISLLFSLGVVLAR